MPLNNHYIKRVLQLSICTISILSASCHIHKSQETAISNPNAIGNNIQIVDSITNNMAVEYFLQPYKDSMNLQMAKVIFHLDTVLSNQYTVGNLGNKSADYMFETAKNWLQSNKSISCDFAVLNNGSIRNSLFPGDVNLGNMYEAMPYENELVIVKLSQKQVDTLFLHIAQKNGASLSQAALTIDFQKPINTKINTGNNKDFYWVAINSYMWLGGDGYQILTKAIESYNTNLLIRDILIQGFQKEYQTTGKINPQPVPRIQLLQPINSRH